MHHLLFVGENFLSFSESFLVTSQLGKEATGSAAHEERPATGNSCIQGSNCISQRA